MTPTVTLASQLEGGDAVEGYGTVTEVLRLTDKTITVVYAPFPEYVAVNGVQRREVRHARHSVLRLRQAR